MLFYKKVMINNFEGLGSFFVSQTLGLAHRFEYDGRGTGPDVVCQLIDVDISTSESIDQR